MWTCLDTRFGEKESKIKHRLDNWTDRWCYSLKLETLGIGCQWDSQWVTRRMSQKLRIYSICREIQIWQLIVFRWCGRYISLVPSNVLLCSVFAPEGWPLWINQMIVLPSDFRLGFAHKDLCQERWRAGDFTLLTSKQVSSPQKLRRHWTSGQ